LTIQDREASLTEHLGELRKRLIVCIIAVAVSFVFSYTVIERIFAAVAMPLKSALPQGTSLIFTSYPEALFTYLKLSLVCAIFISSPVILYQVWAFIAPGLYKGERKLFILITFFSSFFFVAGGLFGYFIAFPAAFKFLASYGGKHLNLLPSVSEYFTLSIRLLLGFGLAFEVPVIMTILGFLGIIDSSMLRKNRKYALLIIFVVAAILTPTPDILNQFLMAGPLIVLYEISIILVAASGRRRKRLV
jgi:sec-independent protein translocase protein TatC